jgi:hypothetical protein
MSRNVRNSLLITAVLSCLLGPRAVAQVTRSDSANVLLHIAQELRDAGAFARARVLMQVLLDRYGETPEAHLASDLLAQLPNESDTSGMVELVAWHTLFGTAVGALVPAAFGLEGSSPYGAGILLGGPIGFFGSHGLAKAGSLTSGQALAIDFGSMWGMIQGPMIRDWLNIGEREVCFPSTGGTFCREETPDEAVPAAMLVGGLSGLAIAALVAPSRHISTSTGLSMIFGSHWGIYFGFLAATLVNAEEGEGEIPFMLIGGNGLALAAALGMPKLGWRPSRVWMVHLGGLMGVAAGFGVGVLTDPDSEFLGATIMTVAGLAGLGLGIAVTRADENLPTGAGPAMGGALFNLRGQRVQLGVPLPLPSLVPSRHGDGRALGLRLSLVKGTF